MQEEDEQAYVQAVLSLYRRLPDTTLRPRRNDRQLAAELFHRAIPLDIVEAALRLAQGRRQARPKDADPLPPIRSLHYFLPVLDELSYAVPPPGYLDYLRLTVPDKPIRSPRQTKANARRLHSRPRQLSLPFDTGAGPKNDGFS